MKEGIPDTLALDAFFFVLKWIKALLILYLQVK
jgi:hypothetical protein